MTTAADPEDDARAALLPPTLVRNRIGHALYRRVKRAHDAGQSFRIIVIIPLLPAFNGRWMHVQAWGTGRAAASDLAARGPHVRCWWQACRTIRLRAPCASSSSASWTRSPVDRTRSWAACTPKVPHRCPPRPGARCHPPKPTFPAPESAVRTGINPRKYVGFFSLRSWTELDVLRTTVVYVHSKLMIVDDRIVIVGSGTARVGFRRKPRDGRAHELDPCSATHAA